MPALLHNPFDAAILAIFLTIAAAGIAVMVFHARRIAPHMPEARLAQEAVQEATDYAKVAAERR